MSGAWMEERGVRSPFRYTTTSFSPTAYLDQLTRFPEAMHSLDQPARAGIRRLDRVIRPIPSTKECVIASSAHDVEGGCALGAVCVRFGEVALHLVEHGGHGDWCG